MKGDETRGEEKEKRNSGRKRKGKGKKKICLTRLGREVKCAASHLLGIRFLFTSRHPFSGSVTEWVTSPKGNKKTTR